MALPPGIPAEVEELLAVDMAAVGEGQTSDEQFASICVKDLGGPYHHGLATGYGIWQSNTRFLTKWIFIRIMDRMAKRTGVPEAMCAWR